MANPCGRSMVRDAQQEEGLCKQAESFEVVLVLGAVAFGCGARRSVDQRESSTATAQGAASPTNSSPIAITSDDRFVWSVNPDNNSVSVFNVADDANQKVAEIPVGIEPGAWPSRPTTPRST